MNRWLWNFQIEWCYCQSSLGLSPWRTCTLLGHVPRYQSGFQMSWIGQTHPEGNQLYVSAKLRPLGVLSTIYDIIAKRHKKGRKLFQCLLDLSGWFCISYKTHSGSNKRGSISFMMDNMHYVNLEFKNKIVYLGAVKLKKKKWLYVLGNTFNLHSNSTLCPKSVVSQLVSKGE